MEALPVYVKYFFICAGATSCGIVYWMAIENMKDIKYKMLYVFLSSLLLTPLGAWFISIFIRAGQLSTKLKGSN